MFTLKGRQDGFKLILPDEFIVDEIKEKYANIIKANKSFITRPIDFLNETIQGIQVLGFVDSTMQQQQPGSGKPMFRMNRIEENRFAHTASEVSYRSEKNPINLIDKTLNINFRHTLGYVNYFMIFENFFYLYSRDMASKNLVDHFSIELYNQNGEAYSRIMIYDPIINGIDMLDLNYTQPMAQSQTFKVEFKYNNLDYQFLEIEKEES